MNTKQTKLLVSASVVSDVLCVLFDNGDIYAVPKQSLIDNQNAGDFFRDYPELWEYPIVLRSEGMISWGGQYDIFCDDVLEFGEKVSCVNEDTMRSCFVEHKGEYILRNSRIQRVDRNHSTAE